MKKIISMSMALMIAGALFLTPAKKVEAAYGMAGCGLGAVIMGPKNDLSTQLVAAIINGVANYFVGLQTFAITSGTLECTDKGVIKAEMEQKVYAYNNFDNLRQDMARGEGETLTSFAFLMGCEANSVDAFGEMTQNNYEQIFTEEATPDSLVSDVKELAKNEPELAAACSLGL